MVAKNTTTIPPAYEILSTDVLIIGAGGAGLRAAIEAHNSGAKVLIITKEYMGGAHTSMAMGGINVAIKKPATPKQHYSDTINGGWFINNYKMVDIFTKEMPERIYDLERYGVKFDRLPDGSFYAWAGGKQSAPLNLCAGDYTGREMINGLVAEIKRLKIAYLDDYFVSKVFQNNGRVTGVFLINLKTGEYQVVEAKATIVATGGAGMLYLVNTNAPSNTGEGYAWALDAGAHLIDMEMIQFHPTGMAYPEKKGTLVTEKVRGHGGILKNKDGERFMTRYQPKRMELAGRDEVTRAIFQEIGEGRGTKNGGVYLDITHWEKGQAEKLIPDVYEAHKEIGIDITKTMMEITPSMHHVMGGIKINEWGETGVTGFYAAGEVASGVHGANRLGGNSIAEGQVFGRRVGEKAAKFAKKSKLPEVSITEASRELKRLEDLKKKKNGISPKTLIMMLRKTMWNYVGIIRTKDSLKTAEKAIKDIRKQLKDLEASDITELKDSLELQAMIDVAESIVASALLRKESRGGHYRSDYPTTKKSWEKNIAVSKSQNKLKITTIPVVR